MPGLSFRAVLPRLVWGLGILAAEPLATSVDPEAAAANGGPPPVPLPVPGEEVRSVALHVHGSFSEGAGSMEWHTERAHAWGVDAIWWTDHDWRLERWNHTRSSGFEQATWDPQRRVVTEPDEAYPGETLNWFLQAAAAVQHAIAVVDGIAYQGSRSLRLDIAGPGTDQFLGVRLVQKASRLQSRYSLAFRPRLRVAVLPQEFDPDDTKIVVEVDLSEHPEGRHRLRYVAGSQDGETDAIPVACEPGRWNELVLDVAADARQRYSNGGADSLRAEDNNLYEVRLGVTARGSGNVVVYVDDFRIETDPDVDGSAAVAKAQQIARYWEELYPGVTEFVGTEISRLRPQPHLNAFVESGSPLVEYGEDWDTVGLGDAVAQIHERGGLVSLNHPFHLGVYPNPGETPEQKAQRILDRKRELLDTRASGCDILEVGYRWRGGANLDDLLDAWDTLAANGVILTGDGVTDTHGPDLFDGWGPWQPDYHHENNFVTWLFLEDSSPRGFLDALRAGRAFFGDPHEFAGTIDLATTEGFPMGRVVLTNRDAHDIGVRVTGLATRGVLHVLQVAMLPPGAEPTLERQILREESFEVAAGPDFLENLAIDTSRPCLVRMELRAPSGEPWAFSNPIYFVRDVPAQGVPAARIGAVLEDVVLEQATGVVVEAVRLDPRRATLTIAGTATGREMARLRLRCGARGVPAGVRGAPAWSYDDGVLELQEFGGGAFECRVAWADFAAEREWRLALDIGRPNPFGAGTALTFSLSRAGPARLSILDVRGRVVRVLIDGRGRPGFQTVTWDGRDADGRVAANGVYFVRLEAEGQTRVRRAVKLR